jgi:aspartate ammonia-lyase
LFEHNPSSNPDDYLNTKKFILEHLSGKKPETINEVEQQVRELDPDIRKLSLKILIERFNQKYQGLNEKQKTLLAMYINEDSRRTSFKDYIFNEITTITKELKRLGSNVKNEVSRIKLNETINLAQNIINSKTLKEEHLTAMLKYYELIEELKK